MCCSDGVHDNELFHRRKNTSEQVVLERDARLALQELADGVKVQCVDDAVWAARQGQVQALHLESPQKWTGKIPPVNFHLSNS